MCAVSCFWASFKYKFLHGVWVNIYIYSLCSGLFSFSWLRQVKQLYKHTWILRYLYIWSCVCSHTHTWLWLNNADICASIRNHHTYSIYFPPSHIKPILRVYPSRLHIGFVFKSSFVKFVKWIYSTSIQQRDSALISIRMTCFEPAPSHTFAPSVQQP